MKSRIQAQVSVLAALGLWAVTCSGQIDIAADEAPDGPGNVTGTRISVLAVESRPGFEQETIWLVVPGVLNPGQVIFSNEERTIWAVNVKKAVDVNAIVLCVQTSAGIQILPSANHLFATLLSKGGQQIPEEELLYVKGLAGRKLALTFDPRLKEGYPQSGRNYQLAVSSGGVVTLAR